MLRSLKLCILLKVLMTLALMTFAWRSSVRQSVHGSIEEDPEYPKNFLEGAVVFEPIEADEYVSSKIESVQKYSDSVIVGNEIVLQESTTPSPKGTPSEPTFLRAFVEFGNRLNKTDIFVTFRWNKPEFTNGVIQKYRVQYWFIENLRRIRTSVDIIPDKILQHKVYDLKLHTVYYFKVQAYNEVGAGPYTKFINVSTTNENPIPISLIVGVDATIVQVLDVDLQIGFEYHNFYDDDNYNTIYKEIIYSALEHKIYGITKTLELITWDFNSSAIKTNPNYTKIANLDSSAHNLCIDWIARNLYWIEVSNQTNNLMKLDLTLWQMGIVKYDNILKINEFKCLNVLPSKGYFYWIGLISDKQYMIMQSDFEGKNVKPFFKNEDKCFCPYKLLESESVMQIDNTNIDKPLIYWTLKDRLIVADISGCRCNQILSAGNQTNFVSLTIDNANIYLHCRNEGQIYILKKKYALESKGNAFRHVQKTNILLTRYRNIKSLDKSLQPYSLTRCLTPNVKDYHVDKVNITANSITVRLPEPILNDGCERYNLATTIYNISVNYLTCLDNDLNKSEEFNVQTYERHYEFQNLTPFTEYTFKLALSNFYVDKFSMDFLFGADVKLTTIPGKLNAPGDVTVQVLTPTLAAVYWMPLKKLNCVAVKYEVHWMQLLNSTQGIIQEPIQYTNPIDKPERTLDGKFFTIIQSLLPKQKYEIYVSVYPTVRRNFSTESLPKRVYMSEPNNLILSGVSTNGMNISWIPSANLTIHTGLHYILEYKNDAMREWQIANNTEKNNDKISYYVDNLLPRTKYKFRLILRYPDIKDFIWSPDGDKFTFETLGDVTNIPSAPGIPTVTRLSNFTYQLNWEPAQANDSQAILYRLEGLTVENNNKEGNQTDKNENWSLYYNGRDNYWVITRDMDRKYRFRVQAENAYGFGAWSKSSVVVDLTESIEISAMQYYLPVILSLIVTLVICYVYYFYCSNQRRKENNEQVLSPNIELAAIYEMPYGEVQLNDTS